jgi:hypothetical protein
VENHVLLESSGAMLKYESQPIAIVIDYFEMNHILVIKVPEGADFAHCCAGNTIARGFERNFFQGGNFSCPAKPCTNDTAVRPNPDSGHLINSPHQSGTSHSN